MRCLSLALLLVACGSDPSQSPSDAAVSPDVLQDASPDSQGDDAPEVADVLQDAEADIPSDTAAPVDAPDAAPADVSSDAVTDTSADTAGDVAAVDAGPLATRATSISVTVHSSAVDWVTPSSSPTCEVTGSTVSVGVEFTRPERAGFTVLGPLVGPVVLTMIGSGGTGASDVRATIERGETYLTDGETVRRTNVRVTGRVGFATGASVSLDLTALGCVLR